MGKIRAIRYHDISMGHRVYQHEGKCKSFHGHNYRIHFIVEGKIDEVGRVLDFSVIKEKLCMWLEENWDHKFILYGRDEILNEVIPLCFMESLVVEPFNPTAENMAKYLVEEIGPKQLIGTHTQLVGVRIEETRKCSASYFLEDCDER